MNQRRNSPRRACTLALIVACRIGLVLSLVAIPARAQQITTLIEFTNVWKYDQSGLDLDTAWRTNDYDDSAWASGKGLLGLEPSTPEVYIVHSPINTPLTISSTITTYYFRAKFNFDGLLGPLGFKLIATNLVDDGCAIYLNGSRVGGVRAPANFSAATFFSGPTTEGQLDVVTFTNLIALRNGANLIAVEVHQSSNPNSDLMWGMKLIAFQETPLVITDQPQSQTATIGDPVTLGVGVSGGSARYQWQKNGVNVANATNANFSIPNVALSSSGEYRVIVTNLINAVTSSVATVTVFADTTGPKLMAAIANNSLQGPAFGSNTINVFFSESVNSTARNRDVRNYTLTKLGTTNTVVITNILGGASISQGVLLYVNSVDPLIVGSNYILTVNNLTDLRGNVIAPNSQVAVSWLSTTNISLADSTWSFHASAVFDPEVYEQLWQATNYVEGSWWAQGQGLFYGRPVSLTPCIGSLRTPTGSQPEPTLFRTAFLWPTNWPTSLSLRVHAIFDDGMILYLNGVEIYRANMPASVSAQTRATSVLSTCSTNLAISVTNLRPGTNWLAAAVAQAINAIDFDSVFGLGSITASAPFGPSLPETPPPVLNVTALDTNVVRLSWTGGGYALESSTNLNLGPASYPTGPWQQVTNMANPYTYFLAEPQRFFRLKK